MSRILEIRKRLGLTQTELAEVLGCTQGNVGHYERGQLLRPDRASYLIAFAASRDLRLTMDHIYGSASLPALKEAKRKTARG
jgi:putative transcriptional regulator